MHATVGKKSAAWPLRESPENPPDAAQPVADFALRSRRKDANPTIPGVGADLGRPAAKSVVGPHRIVIGKMITLSFVRFRQGLARMQNHGSRFGARGGERRNVSHLAAATRTGLAIQMQLCRGNP
jgi:hypothetical protein